ncbi:hypothetical protein IV203_008668 [Nitzschia inconspicua]|uniref:Uncharacterized protein n=1 Tax=Nitzschia inconspicua TaxID=303405 RepID=A0A9K3L0J8_9STRA|nr:hypothetical protein IV203_008668 [Nitzschia inconspicua]
MSNGSDSNKDVEPKFFLRQFAAEIAAALREQDEKESKQLRLSQSDTVYELYRALVFDEPLLDSIPNLPVAASALSRQLLDANNSDYALSNRLVNGILYVCQRQSSSSNNQPMYQSAVVAMSKLAFTCLIDVPFHCCLVAQENKTNDGITNRLGKYLGSYQGHCVPTREEENSSLLMGNSDNVINETTVSPSGVPPPREEQLPDLTRNEGDQTISDGGDDIDKETSTCSDDHNIAVAAIHQEEIWAAQSDPSDYDFDEGLPPSTMSNNDAMFQQFFGPSSAQSDDWLDPKVLSTPKSPWTINEARNAIGSLLQLASFTILEPFFSDCAETEMSQYTNKLAQLALMLLQPRSSLESDCKSLLAASRTMSDTALLAPLWILRDAASHCDETTTAARKRQQSGVSAYLQTLQTLLAMDQVHVDNITKQGSTPAAELYVASIVGLSALSAWCTMVVDQPKAIVSISVETVVDGMNDLTHILERTFTNETYQQRLPTTLIPLLEILTGIHYDRVYHNLATVTENATAQPLLNSGFLGQMLALAIRPSQEGQLPPSHPLYHALWGLCITYPKIIGRYVFRYPGINDLMRSSFGMNSTSEANECVTCILWHSFAWMQTQDAIVATKVMWKSKSGSSTSAAASAPLNAEECQKVCHKAWAQLNQLVKSAIQSDTLEKEDCDRDAITEWKRLLVFARLPSLALTMKQLLDASILEDITTAFQNLPKEDSVVKEKPVKAKDDNGQVIEETNNDIHETNKPSQRNHIVAEARKVFKEYNLYFQGAALGSSKTD